VQFAAFEVRHSLAIADMCWVKKQQDKYTSPEDTKIRNRNFIKSFFTPLLSIIFAKISFTLR